MALLLGQAHGAFAQLRVVAYNTNGNPRAGTADVYRALGVESVNGIAKAPDIITLQEQSSNVTANHLALLNSLYGAGAYAATTLFGAGDSTQSIIYKTGSVQLIGQELIGAVSTSGQPRQALRAEFRPVGYDSSADFYVYSSHFKSSDSGADANRRNVEAVATRQNADALGPGRHILYTGDFNFYRSSDPAFQTMTAAGNGQAFDPINRIGNWHDNASFLDVHTQNPRSGSNQGGMDDRFDFQLASAAFLDNEGLAYIADSYRAFGNTGTHLLNGSIQTGSAAALAARLPGYTEAQAAAVLAGLESASDHLPVVADYQLPAMMGVTGPGAVGPVITGANVNVTFSVANTANVVASHGADELDYSWQGSGALIGSGAGVDEALGGANTHAVALDTGGAGGVRSGALQVTSTSQSVAHGSFVQDVTYTVLDHARASFSGGALTTSAVLDFGLLDLASGPISLGGGLFNLLTASGFTAGLDLDGIDILGDSSLFSLGLSPFANLAAGESTSFDAWFLGGAGAGTYEAIFRLLLSDQDLPGAASLAPLELTLRATVAPEPGAMTLIIAGLALFAVRARRGKNQAALIGR